MSGMTTIIDGLRWVWGAFARVSLLQIAPIVLSLIALYLTLHDRKPKLKLRERKGHWCTIMKSLGTDGTLFSGVIEAYNAGGRTNAIRDYEFSCKKTKDGDWERMESEYYQAGGPGEEKKKHNITPLALAPYSGIEVPVMAILEGTRLREMPVRIEVQDLFGKRYRLEVLAKE